MSIAVADEDELAVLRAAEQLAEGGARATDVDVVDGVATAFGLFDTDAEADRFDDGRAIWLPPAEAVRLPDLSARPVSVGGIRICAPGSEASDDGAALVIEAGGAFGGGQHPTTAMMLERAAITPVPRRVLDVGTGTGILALAQLHRGAEVAVGTDILPEARLSATTNATRSGFSCRFSVIDEIPSVEQYDLVLANLRGRIIVELASQLARAVAPDGRILLSGIRFYEHQRVERRLHALDLKVTHRCFADGWWCLEMQQNQLETGVE